MKQPVQFSIRYLLFCTAFFATVFAIARVMDWNTGTALVSLLVVFAPMAIAFFSSMLPMSESLRRWSRALLVLTLLAMGALVLVGRSTIFAFGIVVFWIPQWFWMRRISELYEFAGGSGFHSPPKDALLARNEIREDQ